MASGLTEFFCRSFSLGILKTLVPKPTYILNHLNALSQITFDLILRSKPDLTVWIFIVCRICWWCRSHLKSIREYKYIRIYSLEQSGVKWICMAYMLTLKQRLLGDFRTVRLSKLWCHLTETDPCWFSSHSGWKDCATEWITRSNNLKGVKISQQNSDRKKAEILP